MKERIVRMGEIETGFEGHTLTSLGLGSCVAVMLYDSENRIGGMAHIMLPDSSEHEKKPAEKKVMIADKDYFTRESIKKILANYGFIVVSEPQEKQETVISYMKNKPDVTLISAFLPPTNGIDVISSLYSFDNGLNSVILSPRVSKEVILHYLNSGANEIMTNPFTENKVIGCINYLVHKRTIKFADMAIPILIGKMLNLGAYEKNITAKIIGGAHLFQTGTNDELLNIGKRNTIAVKAILGNHGIKIISEETGGKLGRTVRFDINTGIASIRSKEGIKEL